MNIHIKDDSSSKNGNKESNTVSCLTCGAVILDEDELGKCEACGTEICSCCITDHSCPNR